MLLGGYFFEKKPTIPKVCLWVGLLLSFVIWHFRPSSGPFGIIRLYDGTLFVSSLGGLLLAYEENLPKFKVVEIISGITLEIYLVNEFIIRKLSNLAFPVNMICAFCLILLSALCINYFTKIMTKYSKRLMEWLSRKTS